MSVGENQEQSQTGSGAEETGEQGPKGTTTPSTPYAEQDKPRIGSKLDIRSTDGEEGDSAPAPPPPPDTLRNAT